MTTSRDMTIDEFYGDSGPSHHNGVFDWVKSHCTTMQECWEKMTDPIGLFSLASRRGVLTAREKWGFALFCCELAKPYLTDLRSVSAISILRLWLTSEVGLHEFRLASQEAEAAWYEEMDENNWNWATVVVATAIYVRKNAGSAKVPEPFAMMFSTTDNEDIDPARLVNWLRIYTKPNFTKKRRLR
jgi:hypothetical protein